MASIKLKLYWVIKWFEHIPYINYYIYLRIYPDNIKTLINFGRKINTIYPNFAKKLSLMTWKFDAKSQKIYGSFLKTYDIVTIVFSVKYKAEKTFLGGNILTT